MYYQVWYELNANNRKREIQGLLQAMNKFDKTKGCILTYDHEEIIPENNKEIVVIPL